MVVFKLVTGESLQLKFSVYLESTSLFLLSLSSYILTQLSMVYSFFGFPFFSYNVDGTWYFFTPRSRSQASWSKNTEDHKLVRENHQFCNTGQPESSCLPSDVEYPTFSSVLVLTSWAFSKTKSCLFAGTNSRVPAIKNTIPSISSVVPVFVLRWSWRWAFTQHH